MKKLGYLLTLTTTIGAVGILSGCGAAEREPESKPPVVQSMDIKSSDESSNKSLNEAGSDSAKSTEAGSGNAGSTDAAH